MINFWNIPASDSYLETPSLPLCKIDKLSFICIISIWMWVREEGREMAGLDFISYLYLSKSSLIYFNESPHLKIQVGARATTFLQQIRATCRVECDDVFFCIWPPKKSRPDIVCQSPHIWILIIAKTDSSSLISIINNQQSSLFKSVIRWVERLTGEIEKKTVK